MRHAALLLALTLPAVTGCFSWSMPDPPPRELWSEPDEAECDPSRGKAIAAFVVAATAFAFTASLGAEDSEEEQGPGLAPIVVVTVPIMIGYLLDGLNALDDAGECRAYQAYRRDHKEF